MTDLGDTSADGSGSLAAGPTDTSTDTGVSAAPAPVTVNDYPDGGAPTGTPVPFVTSTDPNNADGGSYLDPGAWCASGSASTIDGVPVCD